MKIFSLLLALFIPLVAYGDFFSFIDFSETPIYTSQRTGILTPNPYSQQTTHRLIHQLNAAGLVGLGFVSIGGTFRIIHGTETTQSTTDTQNFTDQTAFSGLAYGLQAHIHLHYYLDVFGVYYLNYFESSTFTFSDVTGSSELASSYINPLEVGLSFNIPILKRVNISARLKYVYMPYASQTHTSSLGTVTELYKFSQIVPSTPRVESVQAAIALRFYL